MDENTSHSLHSVYNHLIIIDHQHFIKYTQANVYSKGISG